MSSVLAFIFLCSLAAVPAVSLPNGVSPPSQNAAAGNLHALTNVSDSCKSNCHINGAIPGAYMWSWARNGFAASRHSIELTVTVVTIINTVLDATSTSTQLPPEYTYPPTNSLGTHVETVSFGGSTTVLTYPTQMFAWPTEYFWEGTLSTGGSCITYTETPYIPVPITTSLQPNFTYDDTGPYVLDIDFAEDPEGLYHEMVFELVGGLWQLGQFSALLPDQAALTSCRNDDEGPNWGAFTQTNWYTIHKTMTMDEKSLLPTSTTAVLTTEPAPFPIETGIGGT